MDNITTINWHLLKACNMKCKFCYATFQDIKESRLNKLQGFLLLEKLWETGRFLKINFAGGEPTLIKNLDDYIIFAKNLGFETSIVSNGSNITYKWLEQVKDHLDIIGLSVDSVCDQTNILSGRAIKGLPFSIEQYLQITQRITEAGILLKINTVVNQLNYQENMSEFINSVLPFRWKILQATALEGQNDAEINRFMITNNQFKRYVDSNSLNLNCFTKIVAEDTDNIQGSYLMIDQLGRFYESSSGKHHYSDAILEKGVEYCLNQINADIDKFIAREGNYSMLNTFLRA